MIKLIIVIPTYNESENIEKLIDQIFSLNLADGYELQILIVDGNSPDYTAKICEELKKKYPKKIHIIQEGKKTGRGNAGRVGLKYACGMEVDYVMEMDADFSHDPKFIPIFISLAKHYDVVIGSRFVEGGAQVDRELHRELISILANMLYKTILGLKINDISGGFKCYRKEALEQLDFENFFSSGYPVGMETLYRLYKKGFSFIELPVIFPNRQYGVSKFLPIYAIDALWISLKLLFKFGSASRLRIFIKKIFRIKIAYTKSMHIHGLDDKEK